MKAFPPRSLCPSCGAPHEDVEPAVESPRATRAGGEHGAPVLAENLATDRDDEEGINSVRPSRLRGGSFEKPVANEPKELERQGHSPILNIFLMRT
jgi:hypothetical protein